jgi:DNA invertase Pin-like site-specific DNA recombinase
VIEDLHSKDIGFVSLQDRHDTTTSGGKLVFHIFASLAEFERDLIRERTMAGLAAARARGRLGGRSRKLDQEQLLTLERMYNSRAHRVKVMCEMLSISKATFYRNLKIIQEKQAAVVTTV